MFKKWFLILGICALALGSAASAVQAAPDSGCGLYCEPNLYLAPGPHGQGSAEQSAAAGDGACGLNCDPNLYLAPGPHGKGK